MDRTLRIFFVLLLAQISAHVFGLHCFHCSSVKEGSGCETDVKELKKGVFSKFAINCSDHMNLTNPVCAIEIRKSQGIIQKILRSCSDGETFSFNRKLPHLQNMKSLNPKTNVTICGFHEGLTCVSLCDTDMCNGPEGAITSFNSSGTILVPSMPLIIGTSISFVGMRP